MIAEFRSRLARCNRRGIARAVRGVALRKPVFDDLVRITAPTLVIVGADDKPTPTREGAPYSRPRAGCPARDRPEQRAQQHGRAAGRGHRIALGLPRYRLTAGGRDGVSGQLNDMRRNDH